MHAMSSRFLIEPREHWRRANDGRCADESESRPACRGESTSRRAISGKLLVAKANASFVDVRMRVLQVSLIGRIAVSRRNKG
jgi:hypothetical protein